MAKKSLKNRLTGRKNITHFNHSTVVIRDNKTNKLLGSLVFYNETIEHYLPKGKVPNCTMTYYELMKKFEL